MISFQALGLRFTLPLLTLLFPILARQLGLRGSMAGLLIALGAHEAAHAAAAAWLGVRIQEIRLMMRYGMQITQDPADRSPFPMKISRLLPGDLSAPHTSGMVLSRSPKKCSFNGN